MKLRRLMTDMGSPRPVQPVSRTLSLARTDPQVLAARLNRSQSVGSRRDLTGRVGHAPFRAVANHATTLTAAKGRLIRCTVPGSTPNRLSATGIAGRPTAGLRRLIPFFRVSVNWLTRFF